jgi:hypothetical protein
VLTATMAPLDQPPVTCRRCYRRHRHWRTVAQCRWPRVLWVMGTGPWASVSYCHPGCTVQLYPTEAEALKAKALIDRLACGGRCHRHHRVIDLRTEA